MSELLSVKQICDRRNRWDFGVTALIAVAGIAWMVYARDYLLHLYQGPETITLSELVAMGPDASGRLFSITADVPARHLLQTTRSKGSSRTTVANHFALITDKVMIVETTADQLPPHFVAWASEFDHTSATFERATQQLKVWGVNAPVAPIALDVAINPAIMRWLLAAVLLGAALAIGRRLQRYYGRLADYTRTPAIGMLAQSVRAGEGVPTLIAEIDKHLTARKAKPGRIMLPRWIIDTSGKVDIVSADDVLWIAPYIVKTKVNFVVTVAKRHEIRLITRTGRWLAMPFKQDEVEEALKVLGRWAPWAVIGGSDVMEQRFHKTKMLRSLKSMPSRQAIIDVIDKRRTEIAATRGRS